MIRKLKLNLIITIFGMKTEIKKLSKERYKKNLKSYKKHFFKIDNRTPKESVAIMTFHRMVSIMGLALFKVLQDEGQPNKKSIKILHELLWRGPYGKNVRLISFFVRRTKDPFTVFLKILGPLNEKFFPCPPWEKSSVAIENGVGWHQTKCYFLEFFKKEGQLELCRAYGDCDCRVSELFPEVLELKREKAMCWGDDYCDFLYYKNNLIN